jgi:hypothetical protein
MSEDYMVLGTNDNRLMLLSPNQLSEKNNELVAMDPISFFVNCESKHGVVMFRGGRYNVNFMFTFKTFFSFHNS